MATEKSIMMSPSPFGELGDDLLLGVLSRLRDYISACRCKSVCKRWKSIISDPYFSHRFVAHNKGRSAGDEELPPLVTPDDIRRRILSFLPVPTPIQFCLSVFDCFRDLLLLSFAPLMDYHKLVRTFLVCNPFTKQWVALPLAPPRPIGGRVSIARLVCRPSSSVVTLDAGDVSKPALTHHFEYEFRVVRMSRFKSSVSELDVFCSKSGEWTMVALDLGGRLTPRWGLANTVVSLNGKLYWMNTGSQVIRWNPFSLEVEEEEDHDALRIPRGVSDSEIEFCLCVSQGDLCLFFIDGVTFESPRDVLSVWRQGYGRRGWRRYHQVALNKLMSRIVYDQHGREIRRFELEFSNVVGQHPEKSEIVLVEFLYPNGQIGVYSCNLRTKELKFLFEQKDYFQGHMVFQPKVSLWPTQFSNYEKLRGCYDGSYSGWVQSSNQSTS